MVHVLQYHRALFHMFGLKVKAPSPPEHTTAEFVIGKHSSSFLSSFVYFLSFLLLSLPLLSLPLLSLLLLSLPLPRRSSVSSYCFLCLSLNRCVLKMDHHCRKCVCAALILCYGLICTPAPTQLFKPLGGDHNSLDVQLHWPQQPSPLHVLHHLHVAGDFLCHTYAMGSSVGPSQCHLGELKF